MTETAIAHDPARPGKNLSQGLERLPRLQTLLEFSDAPVHRDCPRQRHCCTLITHPGSGVSKVEDIKGQRLAFTSETLNPGFKAPSALRASSPRWNRARTARPSSAASTTAPSWGVAPQVAPTLAGVTVFRQDINIRESTVLGLVGAGGMGEKLEAAPGTLAWPKVTVLLLAILATVLVSEWVTARVREKLI